jgi:hypothetical protein
MRSRRTFIAIALTTGTALAWMGAILRSTPSGTDVTTFHNDSARTGQNLSESVLTPGNVGASTFGKTAFYPADGKVDAQPLYLSGVPIAGWGTIDVLYVATEHDSVYAIDPVSGTTLWRASLASAGETPSDDRGCSQVAPEIGITSTPVIDRSRGPNGAMYVVAMSRDGLGDYYQRLHALDVATGNELFGGPRTVQARFPGTGAGSAGGFAIFEPGQYKNRAALVEVNGMIVTAWASHCDAGPYSGWIIAYDAATLAQTSVLNVTPNGSEGAIWMAGGGPAADAAGNIYFLDGNGTFDATLDARGFPTRGDYGNGFVKVSTAQGLAVADYFEMFNSVQESAADLDLGSGAAIVLPDLVDGSGRTRHLSLGAGKDMHIYVADRDSMGKWNATSNQIYQDLAGALTGRVVSTPAYFNNTVYFGASADTIKAFSVVGARLSPMAVSATGRAFGYPGATPSISADGASNGILWAVEHASPAVLHAYDPADLTRELYNSNQAPSGRDSFGPGNKFITPTIVNGHVYVGTTNGVAAFGLIGLRPPAPRNMHLVR